MTEKNVVTAIHDTLHEEMAADEAGGAGDEDRGRHHIAFGLRPLIRDSA